MELVSMAEERNEMGNCVPCPPNPYPWGLRFNLTHEQLAKLGYDELPPAGTTLRLEAVACVTRTESCDPDADGDVDYSCIELQIKELGLQEEGDEDEEEEDRGTDRAERMYRKKDEAA